MSAKDHAETFFKELEKALPSAESLKELIKKRYDAKVVQHEAGQPETKGLDEVLKKETFVFDNYFDFNVPIKGPRVTIHSIHVAGDTTFTDHTVQLGFKGAPEAKAQRQLAQHQWDLKTGKLLKEVFWHVYKA